MKRTESQSGRQKTLPIEIGLAFTCYLVRLVFVAGAFSAVIIRRALRESSGLIFHEQDQTAAPKNDDLEG